MEGAHLRPPWHCEATLETSSCGGGSSSSSGGSGGSSRADTGGRSGLRVRPRHQRKRVAVACAAACAVVACGRAAASFAGSGLRGAPPLAGGLGGSAAGGRWARRQPFWPGLLGQTSGASSGVARGVVAGTATQPLAWHEVVPDLAMQGKLRSLGRLLRIAGEKLMDARPAAGVRAVVSGDCRSCDEGGMWACAAALQDVAGALMNEQWLRGADHIGIAQANCGTLFAQEHLTALEALQGLLRASPTAPDPREALTDLSKALEGHAETLSEACKFMEDALMDAAGALRAAARLFTAAPPARRRAAPRAPEAAFWDVEESGNAPVVSPAEITSRVFKVSRENQKPLLRSLARAYHPDRHPGREAQVLPIFLQVQKLRKEWNQWAAEAATAAVYERRSPTTKG